MRGAQSLDGWQLRGLEVGKDPSPEGAGQPERELPNTTAEARKMKAAEENHKACVNP